MEGKLLGVLVHSRVPCSTREQHSAGGAENGCGGSSAPLRRRRWRHTDWQLVSSWLTVQAAEAPHQVVLSGFSFQLFLSCLLLPPILLLLPPLSDWLLQSSWNLQPLLALSREGRGWGD